MNTLESVLGRQGVPELNTIHAMKRILGALENVNYNADAALVNLMTSRPAGIKVAFWSENTIKVYIADVLRLPDRERKRLSECSSVAIQADIARAQDGAQDNWKTKD